MLKPRSFASRKWDWTSSSPSIVYRLCFDFPREHSLDLFESFHCSSTPFRLGTEESKAHSASLLQIAIVDQKSPGFGHHRGPGFVLCRGVDLLILLSSASPGRRAR